MGRWELSYQRPHEAPSTRRPSVCAKPWVSTASTPQASGRCRASVTPSQPPDSVTSLSCASFPRSTARNCCSQACAAWQTTRSMFAGWGTPQHLSAPTRRPTRTGSAGARGGRWQSLWQSGHWNRTIQNRTGRTGDPTRPAAMPHGRIRQTGPALLLIRSVQVRILPGGAKPAGERLEATNLLATDRGSDDAPR